jgi:hypothetical protein
MRSLLPIPVNFHFHVCVYRIIIFLPSFSSLLVMPLTVERMLYLILRTKTSTIFFCSVYHRFRSVFRQTCFFVVRIFVSVSLILAQGTQIVFFFVVVCSVYLSSAFS